MKWLYGIIYSLVAILLTTQVVLWADSVGVKVKPTSVDIPKQLTYDATYAKLDIHTSFPGLFFNLSTVNSYQIVKPFSTSQVSSNMTASIPNGTITVSTSGTYLVTYDYLFYAIEGAQISIDILKNGVQQHRLTREMTAGPERFLTFFNNSGINTVSDIAEYTAKTMTNVTSDSKLIQALSQNDGRFYHIDESGAQGTPAFVLRFGFGSVYSPKRIYTNEAAYAGHEHTVKLKILNTVFNSYTNISDIAKHYPDNGVASLPAKANNLYSRSWNIPFPQKNYVNSNRVVTARIVHTDAGSNGGALEIDKLGLQDNINSIELFGQEYLTCVAGDVISLRIKSNLANTEAYTYSHGLNVIKINR